MICNLKTLTWKAELKTLQMQYLFTKLNLVVSQGTKYGAPSKNWTRKQWSANPVC